MGPLRTIRFDLDGARKQALWHDQFADAIGLGVNLEFTDLSHGVPMPAKQLAGDGAWVGAYERCDLDPFNTTRPGNANTFLVPVVGGGPARSLTDPNF